MAKKLWRTDTNGTWHVRVSKDGSRARCRLAVDLTGTNVPQPPSGATRCPACLQQLAQDQANTFPRPAKSNNLAFTPTPIAKLTDQQRAQRRAEAAAELAAQERRERAPRFRSAGSPGLGKRR